jgi:hypothetical protein
MNIHINDLRKTEKILSANICIPICRLYLEEICKFINYELSSFEVQAPETQNLKYEDFKSVIIMVIQLVTSRMSGHRDWRFYDFTQFSQEIARTYCR